jgi:hypothetical protein
MNIKDGECSKDYGYPKKDRIDEKKVQVQNNAVKKSHEKPLDSFLKTGIVNADYHLINVSAPASPYFSNQISLA